MNVSDEFRRVVLIFLLHVSCALLGFGIFAIFNMGLIPKLISEFYYLSIVFGVSGIAYVSHVSSESFGTAVTKLLSQSFSLTFLCIGLVALDEYLNGEHKQFGEGISIYISLASFLAMVGFIKLKNAKFLNSE